MKDLISFLKPLSLKNSTKFDFFNLKTSVTFCIAECQLLVTNTKKSFSKNIFFVFLTQSWHSAIQKVTEVLKLKKSNFGDFWEKNGLKLLLQSFKIELKIAHIVALVNSFQQNT